MEFDIIPYVNGGITNNFFKTAVVADGFKFHGSKFFCTHAVSLILLALELEMEMLWIAKNCPAARLLQGEIVIDTHLSDETSNAEGSILETNNYDS